MKVLVFANLTIDEKDVDVAAASIKASRRLGSHINLCTLAKGGNGQPIDEKVNFLKLIAICIQAVWLRFRHGIDTLYFFPATAQKKKAVYFNWIVMLLCKPFFRRCIHHWMEKGFTDWLDREGSFPQRWISRLLLRHPSVSVVSDISSMRDSLWCLTREVAIAPAPAGKQPLAETIYDTIGKFPVHEKYKRRGAPPLRPLAAHLRHLRILQIFCRYAEYGGEESSVYRIGDAMTELYTMEYFFGSTAEFLGQSLGSKLMFPVSVFHNLDTAKRLERYQTVGRFDFWQIHNVFPALSPVVYEKAFAWGVPIVHYLHNYRLGCTNGFLLNHGAPCELCIGGNFWPAFAKKSWHNSHWMSGAMGAVLAYTRNTGLFEKVAQWVAISECQKAKHVDMGIPADRIKVIYHFYTPKGPPPPPARDGYALFIGRLSAEKGVAQLVEAWALMQRKDKKLVIAGDGPERPRLEKMAREKGLSNVTFLGFVPAAQQWGVWANAAFSLVPSIWLEPFGMVVLESWANGRAMIANRIGALPELIEHGRTGLLAEPFDSESMARQISHAFDSPDEMVAMGQAGHELLGQKFTRSEWLRNIAKVYSGLQG